MQTTKNNKAEKQQAFKSLLPILAFIKPYKLMVALHYLPY